MSVIGNFLGNTLSNQASAATGNPIGAVINQIKNAGGLIGSIFGGFKPNPNDWKGWRDGDCINWAVNDGDSVSNEAANVVNYIINTKGGIDFMIGQVTPQQLIAKGQRAGNGDLIAIGEQWAKSTGVIASGSSYLNGNTYAPPSVNHDPADALSGIWGSLFGSNSSSAQTQNSNNVDYYQNIKNSSPVGTSGVRILGFSLGNIAVIGLVFTAIVYGFRSFKKKR